MTCRQSARHLKFINAWHFKKAMVWGAVWFVMVPAAQAADRLWTTFVDVQVVDVPLGVPHEIHEDKSSGLVLNNLSDQEMEVDVQILAPTSDQLRGNAEPIPETRWITVDPARFLLPAHASATSRMTLLVPRERRYRKRLYQAMVWSRARPANRKGVTVSAGLLSRLRFKNAKR